MLREDLSEALKKAQKAKEARRVSTLRLILAALKDRDIAARGEGRGEGSARRRDSRMLQTMIRQRRESIKLYEQGGRLELAEQEQEEIDIIRNTCRASWTKTRSPRPSARSLRESAPRAQGHGPDYVGPARALYRSDGFWPRQQDR